MPSEPDIAAFFAGDPLGLAVHARVLELLAPLGEPEVRVTKSQVAYRHRVAFAWTWLPSAWLRHAEGVVVLSLALPYEDGSPRWKEVVHPARAKWMHHLELRDVVELDDEVATWLAAAWDAAG
jgi:hypothetical protein